MTDKIKISHILVKKYSDAQKILSELKSGENFNQLASNHSLCSVTKKKGGLVGEVEKGRMFEEFEQVAFALKEGEVSDIVRTKAGFHILKRESK